MNLIKKHNMFKSRIRLRRPTTVILHHTAGGSISGAESALKSRGLGYHYMIDKDGTVVEYVPTNRRCSHAYRNNTGTVGISYVGGGKFGPINDSQQKALKELLVHIRKLDPKIKNLTGHKHVDPRGWKIDPRWPGEPRDGVNWTIDKEFMEQLAMDTGMALKLKKRR